VGVYELKHSFFNLKRRKKIMFRCYVTRINKVVINFCLAHYYLKIVFLFFLFFFSVAVLSSRRLILMMVGHQSVINIYFYLLCFIFLSSGVHTITVRKIYFLIGWCPHQPMVKSLPTFKYW
jgi:hypothetical protein